jgi:hypothetical protein
MGDMFGGGGMPPMDPANLMNGAGAESGMPPSPEGGATPGAEAPAAPAMPGKEGEPVTVKDLAEMAHMYHVPVSRGTLEDLAEPDGTIEPKKAAAFEQYIITMAQGLFPTFAPQIAAGIPTAHLTEPYRQVAKMTLGDHVEPDFIGDPKWGQAMTGGRDPKTGRPVPMGLDEWKSHMMKNREYGYEFTPQSHQQVAKMMDTMNQAMGQSQ